MKFRCEYTCRQSDGLTVLAATHIVKIVLRSDSAVSIEANGRCTNALDINGLMSLSIENGDVVRVTVDGGDGYDVMENIEKVLTRRTERDEMSVGRQGVSEPVPV